jgi:hypothetical protein
MHSRNQSKTIRFLADRLADEDYMPGRPKSVQDPLDHGPVPNRTRLSCGFRQAAKNIQIMARNDRASLGKRQRQMSVAVIDYVKQIVVPRPLSQPERILDHPVPKPVAVPASMGRPQNAERRSPSPECGPNQVRLDGVAMATLQLLKEDVPDQVHAGPTFFREIAHQA